MSNNRTLNPKVSIIIPVYNGSMYLANTKKFLQNKNFNFENIIKYEMPEDRSVDIDTQADWVLAEYYLNFFNGNS